VHRYDHFAHGQMVLGERGHRDLMRHPDLELPGLSTLRALLGRHHRIAKLTITSPMTLKKRIQGWPGLNRYRRTGILIAKCQYCGIHASAPLAGSDTRGRESAITKPLAHPTGLRFAFL
jgi:hypothetical protein